MYISRCIRCVQCTCIRFNYKGKVSSVLGACIYPAQVSGSVFGVSSE